MQQKSLYQLIVLCILSFTCKAQFIVTKLSKANIPAAVKYKGKFAGAIQWKDKEGSNLLLRTETGIFQSKTDSTGGTKTAELYAWHYLVGNDSTVLQWKLVDFERACELDLVTNFLEKDILVTDLDKNGIAETWLVYQTACRGDVSPANMKIIMHEGTKKYAMKGTRKMKINSTETFGGEYIFDNTFLKGNMAFRTYAQQLWKKHELEKL